MTVSNSYAAVEPDRTEIDSQQGAIVLEFGAPWCGYCRAAQPAIVSAFETHEKVRHIKVEDGSRRPLGRSFTIKLWPTLVFLRDGKEVLRLVRPTDEQAIARALMQIDPAPA